MNASLAFELSPHDFLVKTDILPIQVSPNTFKGFIANQVDLLMSLETPVVIWAKLPRGESWQGEIDRCIALSEESRSLFLFRNTLEETNEEQTAVQEVLSPLVVDSYRHHATSQDRLVTLHLAGDTLLRREFFFIVWSDQFCNGVCAQRSRSKRGNESSEGEHDTSDPPIEASEKRNQLSLAHTLDPSRIQQLLLRLETLVRSSNFEVTDHLAAESPCTLLQIVDQWHTYGTQQPLPMSSPQLVNQLLGKHLHRQEELWQRSNTYRKQAEIVEVLQIQNEELINTVRAKDEFISNVGQELRTPLTNMKTALTLLNSPNLKPPQRQRYMDLLVKECDRQSSLIGSLLDLVSLDQMAERQTLQPISLSDVVPGVVSTYQPLAEEKGVRLAYTIPEGLPTIACLNPWLRQIVVSLLHNGIKFTPRGGQVWVKAKQQGDYIQLEFRDTGVGIPVQEIPKIFDRFYRVRQIAMDDPGGAGLGLTIVQQLLLRCGGSISVKSRPNDGSIFNVLLPIYQYREADKPSE
ncbi:ATP-binding protein [Alkalinema pantanalense CENA528]|uniref:ATP-binding protein n=1 Tax=Alkalinema pantanalense TaxID=1620705 RepID=UPI003D6F1657